MDNKFQRQDHYFSTRLPYANKKIREIYYSKVNTTYKSTQETINKLQTFKSKLKSEKNKKKSNFYDIMKNKMDEDSFSECAQGIVKIYHEVPFC